MEFSVPQFIEKEPRIVGPLTFKQFIFIGVAGGFCLFIHFFVPLSVFILLTVFLMPIAFALAFFKIGKITLPVFIKNFVIFLFRPKIYLWQKKIAPPQISLKIADDKEKSALSITGKSRLRQLFSRLEIKHK